ncbi:MAG: hypothetical protein KBB39_07715 [Phycicoccus sp.]|nr:hypothetical protein [Phycicoccus sp.]
MTGQPPHITVSFGGKTFTRDEVTAKEMVRARRVLRRLGAPPVAGTSAEIRQAVLNRKLELGRDYLTAMVAAEAKGSARFSATLAAASFGRRHPAWIEISATGISGSAFVDWFHQISLSDNEPALLAAHPDHYAIYNTAQGQQVFETLGGAPFVSAFAIDFTDPHGISIPTLADHPYAISGVAVLPSGRRIGGAKHQFRDDVAGLHARLGIDFPLAIPPTIWLGHRWHLAIEFCNWIEAAAAEGA